MKHTIWLLVLFSACAQADRFHAYERHNAAQAACRDGGNMAVLARNEPEQAQKLIAQNEHKKSKVAKAFNEAMLNGLLATPDVSDEDLRMRGWAACMDILDR